MGIWRWGSDWDADGRDVMCRYDLIVSTSSSSSLVNPPFYIFPWREFSLSLGKNHGVS
jgi:hypothetical protein